MSACKTTTLWRRIDCLSQEYKIDVKIANTIQGAIYKARHLATGTVVAVKAVSQQAHLDKATLSGNIKVAEDVEVELMMLRELQGMEGIVQLFDAVEDGNCFFLITKFESGGDLFDFVANEILSEEEVKLIFKCVLEPVSRLHEKGICHLDLSLENVFISDDGEAKIGDFGVARKVCTVGKKLHSSTPLGKPKYMAPEVVEGSEFDGFKADVYSLGIMLFCMLYNSFPYDAPNSDNVGFSLIKYGRVDKFLELQGLKGTRSADAESLLHEMLCMEDERVDLNLLQKHPWLHD
eukprot:TRINITY_DN16673_c0_g1_i1.p1 TRINITY_DN16673_c0_g1~~TRINITY_DN16673_c0_g1_i1.p1  ORF type:complete len:292 (-),score=66.57 TRINITY_DN16673_c0_g1_i1:137-1012(-)